MRLKEPTHRILANNLVDLSERTELIAKESESSREQLAGQVHSTRS